MKKTVGLLGVLMLGSATLIGTSTNSYAQSTQTSEQSGHHHHHHQGGTNGQKGHGGHGGQHRPKSGN